MIINPISTKFGNNIPLKNSIRQIFYSGTTTLNDMTQERVLATMVDATKYLVKPFKEVGIINRILLGIKPQKDIDSEIIPVVSKTLAQMPKKAYSKLQKALVIIEDTKRQSDKIYKDSCEYYSNMANKLLIKVVYK